MKSHFFLTSIGLLISKVAMAGAVTFTCYVDPREYLAGEQTTIQASKKCFNQAEKALTDVGCKVDRSTYSANVNPNIRSIGIHFTVESENCSDGKTKIHNEQGLRFLISNVCEENAESRELGVHSEEPTTPVFGPFIIDRVCIRR